MSAKTKKRIAAAVSVLAVVALLLTGTFAWKDYTQHKTNPFGGQMKPNVTLNNPFKAPDNWTPSSAPVPNQISVTNTQDSSAPVLVRIRFKEYLQAFNLNMDTFLMDDMGTPADPSDDVPKLFATSADGGIGFPIGEYLMWDDLAQANAWLTTYGFSYTLEEIDHDNDAATPDKVFARTLNTELQNGVYGKPMPDPSVAGVKTPAADMLFGGVAHVPHKQNIHDASAVPYLVHTFNGKSIASDAADGWYAGTADNTRKKISDYIDWTLGSKTHLFADWVTAGKTPGNKWVLAEDGWCYWMNGLVPGTTTANALENVSLIVMPGDALEYEIHTDLQAVTSDELSAWDNVPTEIDEIMQSLAKAMVKRSELEGLIKEIESLNPDLYTTQSWDDLQTELAKAKTTVLDPEADLAELTTAVTDLKAARDALAQKPDLAPLQALLDKIGQLNETVYTPDSWTPLKTKANEAIALLNNPNASQADVTNMITELKTAQNNLKKRADFSKLLAAIANAEDASVKQADWNATTWTAFQDALTAAKTANNPNATQAAVDSAAFALTQAQNGLRADKTALETLIGQCDALNQNEWKSTTWTPFAAALQDAKVVYGKPEAKNSEVQAAITALNAAKAALEALPQKGSIVELGPDGNKTQWRVLDIQNGEALLISVNVLETRQWNPANQYVAWSASPMRSYLNGQTFLDKYFTPAQQAAMIQKAVSTDKAYNDTTQDVTDGTDRLFLLSEAEANQYFSSNADRVAKYNGGTYSWWLRSPRKRSYYVGFVYPGGSFGYNVANNTYGVRPALWVDLSSIS